MKFGLLKTSSIPCLFLTEGDDRFKVLAEVGCGLRLECVFVSAIEPVVRTEVAARTVQRARIATADDGT